MKLKISAPFAVFALSLLILFSGCSQRNLLLKPDYKIKVPKGVPVYVVNRDTTKHDISEIKPDHILRIRFLNELALQPNALDREYKEKNYEVQVDADSLISLPEIGKVKVAGLTVSRTEAMLVELYGKSILNPVIEVEIMNRNVLVLGEIGKQGLYELKKEDTNLLELIAEAGGVTPFTKKRKVRIIRGNYARPEQVIVDLTQLRTLKYDELILRGNDIVYFEPTKMKTVIEGMNPIMPFLSLLSVLTTVTFIIRSF